MANVVRDLAAELSIAVCQILEFQKMTKSLPRVNIASIDVQARHENYVGPEPTTITCHICRDYYDGKGELVDRGLDGQIDAFRTWAHKLGADLHLGDERVRSDGYATRRLTADAVLPNGLGVHLYASLGYQVAAEPSDEPAEAVAA